MKIIFTKEEIMNPTSEVIQRLAEVLKSATEDAHRVEERRAFEAWFNDWCDPNIGSVEIGIEKAAAWAAWKAAMNYTAWGLTEEPTQKFAPGEVAISGWKLREVLFDSNGDPIGHREPV